MKKPRMNVIIVKEDSGYSASVATGSHYMATEGETLDLLKAGILEAINLSFQETGFTYTQSELKYSLDLESFFEFYKVINASALSERIGMNQSLLAQYIKGIKRPSAAQTKRILDGVQQIGKELAEIRLLPPS